MWLWIIWGLAAVAALVLYFRHCYSKFSRHGVKSLRVVPPFGNMLGMLLRREHFIDIINRTYFDFPQERFVGRFEFTNPVVVLRDLELIKKVTIKDFEHFLDHRGLTAEDADPLFARNLISLKGQEWKDMRSTLSPAFTSSKMKHMVPFIVDVGHQTVLNLKKTIIESDTGSMEIDVKDLTTRFACDVIASCAFGLKVDSHSDRTNDFYTQGLTASTFKFKQLLKFLLSTTFPWLTSRLKLTLFAEDTQNFFRTLVNSTMHEREKLNIHRPDMIHLLMEAKKGKLIHEEKTHDADAGFATVEESSVGKNDITREGLRKWPPAVALDRLCIKDYNLGKPNDKSEDYIIHKGMGLQIPVWSIHRDPQYFPDPDKFDPERFSEENKHNIKPFTYSPFGLGPRNCIGSRFALCEVKIMLYQLLLHTEISPGPRTTIPAELEKDTFNLKIKGGHWVQFKARA